MKDSIIAQSGNSRYLKSVANFLNLYPTYEAFAQALIAGTLPIDLNGINPAGWQQIGTLLGKANLLSDETETAIWGDAADRTVNDALNKIGIGLYFYYWKRRTVTGVADFGVNTLYSLTKTSTNSTATTISYSDNCTVGAYGKVSLAEPISTVDVVYSTFTSNMPSILAGKYFQAAEYGKSTTVGESIAATVGAIYYIPSDATFSIKYGSSTYVTEVIAQEVTGRSLFGEWEYLSSASRNAYPDQGLTDGYEYVYLGIPFENARESSDIGKGFKRIGYAKFEEASTTGVIELENLISNYRFVLVYASNIIDLQTSSLARYVYTYLVSSPDDLTINKYFTRFRIQYSGQTPYNSMALIAIGKNDDGTVNLTRIQNDGAEGVEDDHYTNYEDCKYLYINSSPYRMDVGFTYEVWGIEA